MNYEFSLWQKTLRILLYIQSWLRLQIISNALHRLLTKEWSMPKMSLRVFESPEAIRAYAKATYQWRRDELPIGKKRIGLDWITDPRIFQAKLEAGVVGDGDCDDYHTWFAECLRLIRNHPNPEFVPTSVYTMSVVWKGGGHTVAVFTHGALCYLVDYDITFVGSSNDKTKWLVNTVLSRHADGQPLRHFVFQDEKLRVVAANEKFL